MDKTTVSYSQDIDRPALAFIAPATKSRLSINNGMIIVDSPEPVPNAWRRFWYWVLLGWRWETIDAGALEE